MDVNVLLSINKGSFLSFPVLGIMLFMYFLYTFTVFKNIFHRNVLCGSFHANSDNAPRVTTSDFVEKIPEETTWCQ